MDEWLPNIRHLAALAATVEHGTVTRAARSVNLTQPAITQAISRLEDELGVQLFERGASGMEPTEPALLLVPRVRHAIALIGSPRVTSTQVRAFLGVLRGGSYAAASEAMGLSSASLHRSVSDLSLALGQRLVERHGRRLVVTPAGERRARALRLAMAELRAGYAELMSWKGQAAGRIVMGAMPLSRARWLPRAIERFSLRHPGVDLVVIEGSHAEMAGPLRDGDIDLLLGALREDGTADDLDQRPVFDDHPRIMLRAGHPALATGGPDKAALRHLPWILPGEDTPLRRHWQSMMHTAGIEAPHVRIECASVLTTRELLINSDALTLLSPDQFRVEIAAGLLVAVDPPVPVVRTIGITVRRDWRPTAPQQAFIDILQQVAIET